MVDRHNYVRQDRRLDGEKFALADGSSAKSRTIGSPALPVGLPTDKPIIVLVEGSSDLLAAYSLIYAESFDDEATPAAMLGAANRIHGCALEHFRGKFVLGFPDYDDAGMSAMSCWERQLRGVAAVVNVFDYAGLLRDDGQPIKDLRDFLRVDVDQWEIDGDARSPLGSFVSELASGGKINYAVSKRAIWSSSSSHCDVHANRFICGSGPIYGGI